MYDASSSPLAYVLMHRIQAFSSYGLLPRVNQFRLLLPSYSSNLGQSLRGIFIPHDIMHPLGELSTLLQPTEYDATVIDT